MATNYTVYDLQTHEIIQRLSHIPVDGLPEGQDWIAGSWDDRFYLVNPETGNPYLKPEPYSRDDLLKMIVRERARRFDLGFDFDFGDERGVHHIGTTDADMKGWRDVDTMAFKAMARGEPEKLIAIATDTGPVIVTASEWLDVLDHAESVRQPIWSRSFELQALDPIPQNVTDPSYWT